MNMKLLFYKQITICVVLVLITMGCSYVSHYDTISYKNFTDLKGEMSVFFNECMKEECSGKNTTTKLSNYTIAISQIYEYEKGKKLNDETRNQVEIIKNNFRELINNYSSKKMVDGKCAKRADGKANYDTGCLSIDYAKGKWSTLSSAIDTAISSEMLKIQKKN